MSKNKKKESLKVKDLKDLKALVEASKVLKEDDKKK